MKLAGLGLALLAALGGFAVAFGAWDVGYCGGLTPDVPPPGTLRHELCRGSSGDFVGGVVVACWVLAAVAPLLGMRWALRKSVLWPLPAATIAGVVPIALIAILAATLPQG